MYIHLGNTVVALCLVVFGYFSEAHPLAPNLQNDMITGLLLMMISIIPTQSTLPPRSWLVYFKNQQQKN